MKMLCEDFENLIQRIKLNKTKIIMYGAGVIGQITIPTVLNQYNVLKYIDCFVDSDKDKWGTNVKLYENEFVIKSPEYLKKCDKNSIIFLNISRYSQILEQLQNMECIQNMECYLTPMMCIHNFCKKKSSGMVIETNENTIPKKIHYMWLGRKKIPDNLKKCIETWYKYCPDYKIIEWNEDNYEFSKHPYMQEAYENKGYGFVPDYARLDILYNEGGIYMDTDVELIKNLDPLLKQEAFCGVEKWQTLNFGGCSGAVKGNKMLKKFLNARKDIHFIDVDGRKNKNTCGFYDTKVILDEGYRMNGKNQNIGGMNIYAYDYFHPYDYMSGLTHITENTYSIHRFNGGWMDESMKLQNLKSQEEYLKLYNLCISEQKGII